MKDRRGERSLQPTEEAGEVRFFREGWYDTFFHDLRSVRRRRSQLVPPPPPTPRVRVVGSDRGRGHVNFGGGRPKDLEERVRREGE